ncbi:hypothetical protein NM688_g6044 [Phlebia brevispora]|uniref:Uncharacterized protein n=1 Tax=Phlebia brevispora TaxID=194682 RepID=A0ACC1SKP9_9APHY|nr:hypothetical protein NM688_g6044 [Phlebia brevispora]
MVNWQDPGVQELCAFVLGQTTNVVLGLYLWYFATTLSHGEGRLIRRTTKPTLAHIPYFIARYSMLASLALICVQGRLEANLLTCNSICKLISPLAVSTHTVVQAFVRINSVTGNMALAGASANLGFRALMIWNTKRVIRVLLYGMSFAHLIYAIFVGSFGVQKRYASESRSCTLDIADAHIELTALYIFTLSWDLLILALTVLGLRRDEATRSHLGSLLYTQGVIYALISTVTCVPIAVLSGLNLNSAMNVVAVPLGSTIRPTVEDGTSQETDDKQTNLLTTDFVPPSVSAGTSAETSEEVREIGYAKACAFSLP